MDHELVDGGAVRGLERSAHAFRVKNRSGEIVTVADAGFDVLDEDFESGGHLKTRLPLLDIWQLPRSAQSGKKKKEGPG